MPAGFTSPVHTHTAPYEAVQIEGTSRHWMDGEDGAKAQKMTPGSYWSMPGKVKPYSACDAGAKCTILIIAKAKFDFKDVTPKPAGGGSSEEVTTSALGTRTPTTRAQVGQGTVRFLIERRA